MLLVLPVPGPPLEVLEDAFPWRNRPSGFY